MGFDDGNEGGGLNEAGSCRKTAGGKGDLECDIGKVIGSGGGGPPIPGGGPDKEACK